MSGEPSDEPSGEPSDEPSVERSGADGTSGLRKTSLPDASTPEAGTFEANFPADSSSLPASSLGSSDDRSAAAKAAVWASRIMTISLEMVVPGLVGYWLDTRLGTKFVLMLAGFVLGFTAAIKHLLHLTQTRALREIDKAQKNH